MSKGRPRHQASRRRMYSARQRELRERRLHAARDEQYSLSEQVTALEIEESLEFDPPTPTDARLRGRANAA